MELAFQTSPIRYLRRLVSTVREQEEMSETIIPDAYPDAVCVIDSYAEPVLRGKDCRDGSVMISGGIKAGIFYQSVEDKNPIQLDFYLPFTAKIEEAQLKSHSQTICNCYIRSVDGQMINSRKIKLRVSLIVCVDAYEQAEEIFYIPQEVPDCVQMRQSSYRFALPLETGEKSFVVSDTIDISSGQSPVDKICKSLCCVELSDRKLIGNKVVFKGVLHCKLLYLDQNQGLHVRKFQIPFSQYCEMQEEYDDESAMVVLALTGYDLQMEDSSELSRATITANLLAQCLITGHRNISVVEDAYAIRGELQARWKNYTFDSYLDRQYLAVPVSQKASSELTQIIDWDVYVDCPRQVHQEDQLQISLPLQVRVMGYDQEGNLSSVRCSSEGTTLVALSDQAACHAQLTGISLEVDHTGAVLQIQGTLWLDASFCTAQDMQTMISGYVDREGKSSTQPGVIVRTVEKNSALWDVAKTYGSTISAICAANNLEAERMPETDLLLIPIG